MLWNDNFDLTYINKVIGNPSICQDPCPGAPRTHTALTGRYLSIPIPRGEEENGQQFYFERRIIHIMVTGDFVSLPVEPEAEDHIA